MNSTKLLIAVLMVLIGMGGCSVSEPDHSVLMYIGTYSNKSEDGIYLCKFDTVSGVLDSIKLVKQLDNPNYLTISDNKEYLYTCVRPVPESSVTDALEAYKIDKATGDLTFINRSEASGQGPCYVDCTADGKVISITNYSSGDLDVFHANEDGSLTESVQSIVYEGSGPFPGRQDASHAHSVQFSPFDNTVYVADLGTDKLMIYQLDEESGLLVEGEQPFIKIDSGAGPRHFEFHPNGKIIYVLNELNSTVSVIETGEGYNIVQNITTLPADYTETNTCADIHISEDGKYLYCSNRGHNSIVSYSVAEDGQLTLLGNVSTHGNWPRNFTLDPSGNFLLVANQKSNNITVYKIDNMTGEPVFTEVDSSVPGPVCLKFL